MTALGGWKGRTEKDGPTYVGRMGKLSKTTPLVKEEPMVKKLHLL